jgi:hypothetical protein
MEFPSVVEANTSAQKQSRPSSPSITSGITGTSSSTLAPGGPSYASVVARQSPDPDILALKEELAELKTTIQAQQQQPQQPSAPPAPNPIESSFPPDFAKTMMEAISSLRAEIAELRNLHQPTSTPSPARKKVCSDCTDLTVASL